MREASMASRRLGPVPSSSSLSPTDRKSTTAAAAATGSSTTKCGILHSSTSATMSPERTGSKNSSRKSGKDLHGMEYGSSSSGNTGSTGADTGKTNHNKKNNVVVCLVFFSLLANHARNITWHMWHSLCYRSSSSNTGNNPYNPSSSSRQQQQHWWKRLCTVVVCGTILIAIPLLVLRQVPSPLSSLPLHFLIVWNALLHVSIWPVTAFSAFVAIWFAIHQQHNTNAQQQQPHHEPLQQEIPTTMMTTSTTMSSSTDRNNSSSPATNRRNNRHNKLLSSSFLKSCSSSSRLSISPFCKSLLFVVLTTAVLLIINCQIQVIAPSWLWNPFLWGRYKLYLPHKLSSYQNGMCLPPPLNTNNALQQGQGQQQKGESLVPDTTTITTNNNNKNRQYPLCLNEASWSYLSGGVLSSSNPEHVQAVLRGLQWAQEQDHGGGLILNVMARDTIDAIRPLRQNVEALRPFFKHLAVVVFENDSTDGTRQAFMDWAAEDNKGYIVDVMQCGPNNPDCKFGLSHRYDALEFDNYFTSSAIGKMAVYRQDLVDYIMTSPMYSTGDYSHMMVMDLDLKVSLSPLGILHTLGTVPDVPVASSGRQVWPGSLGTMTPPYDFSAFRALPTEDNRHLLKIHGWFCGLLPPGDRWRNQCDAASSIHLLLVLLHDWLLTEEAYPTESAFNGATLYPLKLIEETHAKYDVGDDGQRCEHIGFNMALHKPTYVNPKWNFHVMPTNPGGPTGVRSLKSVFRIVFMPRLSLVIFFQLIIFLVTYVLCIMFMTLALVEPIVVASSAKLKQQGNTMTEMNETLPLYDTCPSSNCTGKNNCCTTGGGSSSMTERNDVCAAPLAKKRHVAFSTATKRT